MPLSAPESLRQRLRKLYPNFYATKYRMDINKNGFWDPTKSEEQAREQPKTEVHREQPRASLARQSLLKRKLTAEESLLQTADFPKSPRTTVPSFQSHDNVNLCLEQPPTILPPAIITPDSKTSSSKHITPITKSHVTPIDLTLALDGSYSQSQPSIISPLLPSPNPTLHRQMCMDSGLPLGHDRFIPLTFTERGLESLQGEEWLNDEVLDLFSILQLRDSDDIYYVPSSIYAHYRLQVQRQVPDPRIFSERMFHQPEQHRSEMKSKKMWMATISDNHHWQTLCIINPGKEYCFAILFDSLVARATDPPNNYVKCQDFATRLVNDVYQQDNHSNQSQLCLHIGLVTNQPNYTDCGIYALLSLRHACARVHELTALGIMPTTHDFRNWYTVRDAVQHRADLRDRYENLLDIYAVLVP
jgi:hypothetical protein